MFTKEQENKIREAVREKYPEYSKIIFRTHNYTEERIYFLIGNKPNIDNVKCTSTKIGTIFAEISPNERAGFKLADICVLALSAIDSLWGGVEYSEPKSEPEFQEAMDEHNQQSERMVVTESANVELPNYLTNREKTTFARLLNVFEDEDSIYTERILDIINRPNRDSFITAVHELWNDLITPYKAWRVLNTYLKKERIV